MTTVPMSSAPWSAGSAPATLALPAGATDCHHHIYDARFPVDPRATLRPADALVSDYRLLRKRLGTSRSVVVQPSTYGTDNRCLVDALHQMGDTARGIAVVESDVSRTELDRLHAAGVRGARLNLARPAGAAIEDIGKLARAIEPLGWHLQIHALGDSYVENIHWLRDLPVPLVIDHLGRLPLPRGIDHPAFALLRGLVDAGRTWIKLSGAYHDSRSGAPDYEDAATVFKAWLTIAPERVLWGTDWPHTAAMAGEKPMPDDARLLDLVGTWVPEKVVRDRILVDNPATLYGFTE
jgi:D-galactarolactone isomerase